MKWDKKKQVIKECSALLIATYIDWMIQGERRVLLKKIVLEDVVDFIMTYFAALTLFYLFKCICLYRREKLIKEAKVQIVFRFGAAGVFILLWETFIYFIYSTFYYREPLVETSFFYNGVPMITLLLGFLSIHFYNSYYGTVARINMTPAPHILRELIVSKVGKKIIVLERDIFYFFTRDKLVWLSTKHGELYVVDYTLAELENLLDPRLFFRINRQVISSRHAIQGYSPSTNQKIQVDFLNNNSILEDIMISKYNASKFKKWIAHSEQDINSI